MAGREASIKVNILGDAKGFGRALGDAESRLGQFSSKMDAIGSKMRDVGSSMTLGMTLPIVGALGLGVKWAGELEDAQAASVQVFGAMSKNMDQWAANASKNFGLAKGDAIEWSNQVGIRLRSIGGMSEEAAAAWSQNLTQLGGDFASFFGGTTEDAMVAINSALTGEFEPLKRYGVIINDQAMKNEILALTGKEVTGTLTAQQKQQATLSLLMKQTNLVQGDYARNADGATNSQRTMTAALKDAGTALGTILLPYVTKGVQFVTELTDKFQELSPSVQKFIVIGALVVAALGPLIYVLGTLATAIGFIASPIGLVVLAIAALVAGFVYLYTTNEGFAEWVNNVASAIRDGLVAAFNWIKDVAIPALVDAFNWFVENVLPKLVTAFEWVAEKVGPVFQDIVGFIQVFVPATIALIQQLVEWLTPVWFALWDAVQKVIEHVWPIIQGVIEAAINLIRGIIQTVTSLIQGDWSGVWEGIKSIISAVWDGIVAIVSGAVNILWSVVVAVGGKIGGFFSGVWNTISSAASTAFNSVASTIGALPGKLLGFVGSIASAAGRIGSSILEGIGNGLSGAVGWVGDLGGKIWSSVKGAINSGLDRIRNFGVDVPLLGRITPFSALPRLARGGLADLAGLYTVGERGPETVMLPRGARVTPNHMGGGNGGGGVNVYVESTADPYVIASEVAWAMRTSGR